MLLKVGSGDELHDIKDQRAGGGAALACLGGRWSGPCVGGGSLEIFCVGIRLSPWWNLR